jgi:hypothetical protein
MNAAYAAFPTRSIVNRPLDAASSGGDIASDGTYVLTDATDRVASAQAAQQRGPDN